MAHQDYFLLPDTAQVFHNGGDICNIVFKSGEAEPGKRARESELEDREAQLWISLQSLGNGPGIRYCVRPVSQPASAHHKVSDEAVVVVLSDGTCMKTNAFLA